MSFLVSLESGSFHLSIVEVILKLRNLKTGIACRTHQYKRKKLPYSISGAELLSWIECSLFEGKLPRDASVQVAQNLLEYGVMVCVAGKSEGSETVVDSAKVFYRLMKPYARRVLIIGGGFAGARCAKKLENTKFFNVTLIDQKSYFLNMLGFPLLLDNHAHLERMCIEYKTFLKQSTIIQDEVTMLTDSHVFLKYQKPLELEYFDYVIIATGSQYNPSFTAQTQTGHKFSSSSYQQRPTFINPLKPHELVKYESELHNATTITVVGSGSVGVEIAGSFACKYPKSEIVLISSSSKFWERTCPSAHGKITSYFSNKKNLKVMLGQRLQGISGKTVTTHTGYKFDTDVLISCTGFQPNTAFLVNKTCDNCKVKAQVPLYQDKYCRDIMDAAVRRTKQQQPFTVSNPDDSNDQLVLLQDLPDPRMLCPEEEKLLCVAPTKMNALVVQLIEKGDITSINYLLQNKLINPNAAANPDLTILMVALKQQNVGIIHSLIRHGASVAHCSMRHRNTPLHFVCSLGMTSMAKLLLEQYSSPFDPVNDRGEIPLALAIQHPTTVFYLLSWAKEFHFSNLATWVTICNSSDGSNLVHKAVMHKQAETILTIACSVPDSCLIRLLNMTNDEGNTPLHIVVAQKSYLIALILCMTETVDLLVKNANGETPLQLAQSDPQMKSLLMLIPQRHLAESMSDQHGTPITLSAHETEEKSDLLSASKLISNLGRHTSNILAPNPSVALTNQLHKIQKKGSFILRDEQPFIIQWLDSFKQTITNNDEQLKLLKMIERSFTVTSILDQNGYVKVDKYLRVRGVPNFFALGDITDIQEEKLGLNALHHADTVVQNIIQLENRCPMVPYDPVQRVCFLGMGPARSLCTYGDRVLLDSVIVPKMRQLVEYWVARALKS